MKIVVRSVVLTLIGAVVLLILMTVTGRMNRSMEVRSDISGVTENTVENGIISQTYSIHNEQEYISDFIENLSYLLDTNSDIVVNIEKTDMQKGLLSVKVTEEFEHPNGKIGTVSEERISIFNCLEENRP